MTQQGSNDFLPLVEVFCGIRPPEVAGIGRVVYRAECRCIEVPLKSPPASESLAEILDNLPVDCLGEGASVLSADDVIEAIEAVDYGATCLNLLPAATYEPNSLRTLRAVLPADLPVLTAGSIGVREFGAWLTAATGFGIGSESNKPADCAADVSGETANMLSVFQEFNNTNISAA